MKTAFIFLFFCNLVNGQDISILRCQLFKKDYVKLCDVYNNKSNLIQNSKIGETWGLKRQITKNFYEETKYISIETPLPNKPSVYNIDIYKICILTNDTDVVVYKFQVRKYKKVDSNATDTYYETLDSFQNEKLLETFNSEFSHIFKIKPNYLELFEELYTFGSYCTFGGNPTKGQEEITKLLEAKDTGTILSYLKSTNTEKQLFGIMGANELQKLGYKLTSEDQQIISFIKNKKGKIDYCAGCNFDIVEIKSIINEY